jgi:hypothetical protein
MAPNFAPSKADSRKIIVKERLRGISRFRFQMDIGFIHRQLLDAIEINRERSHPLGKLSLMSSIALPFTFYILYLI